MSYDLQQARRALIESEARRMTGSTAKPTVDGMLRAYHARANSSGFFTRIRKTLGMKSLIANGYRIWWVRIKRFATHGTIAKTIYILAISKAQVVALVRRITTGKDGLSMVVRDVSAKPPKKIERMYYSDADKRDLVIDVGLFKRRFFDEDAHRIEISLAKDLNVEWEWYVTPSTCPKIVWCFNQWRVPVTIRDLTLKIEAGSKARYFDLANPRSIEGIESLVKQLTGS